MIWRFDMDRFAGMQSSRRSRIVPAFAFFCNLPQYVKDEYARYLENKLREHFGFTGVPVRVFFRKK